MVSVPSFLLRKLYVRGTLKNTDQGIQFRLRNTLGSGYAEEMLPLTLDGADVPLHRCFFSVDGEIRRFDHVSREVPFALSLNRDTFVNIENVWLTEEAHTVGMGFRVPGLGVLRFDFTDQAFSKDNPGAIG